MTGIRKANRLPVPEKSKNLRLSVKLVAEATPRTGAHSDKTQVLR